MGSQIAIAALPARTAPLAPPPGSADAVGAAAHGEVGAYYVRMFCPKDDGRPPPSPRDILNKIRIYTGCIPNIYWIP